MKKDIKLVIFDWSGVISDDRKSVYETNIGILQQRSKSLITFEQWLRNPALNAQEFLASQGISGNHDELFNLYKKNFNKTIKSGLIPEVYPEAKEVLQYLKETGKKIAVLSCHPENSLQRTT